MTLLSHRRVLVLLAALIVPTSALTVAYSAIPDPGSGTIHGCFNKATGVLRVVDPIKGQKCLTSPAPLAETQISWNQTGPAGTPGSAGAPGAPGRDGSGVLSGSGAPGADLGHVGDFYLDTTTPVLGGLSPALLMFGPKAASGWPTAGQSLVGRPGIDTFPGDVACSTAPITGPIHAVDVSAPGTIYVGDIVAVGASALGSTCPNPGPYRYQWTLTAPGASHAVLSSGSSPTPTFVADVAGAAYQLSVIVTDRRGNDAAVVHSSVQVSPCGDNLLLVQPDSTPNNDGTFTLRAGATDVDNNIDACPARFSQSIRYAWTIVRQPVGSTSYLTSFDSASPRLVTDAAGVYVIQVTATASNGRTATGQLVLTV